MRTPKNKISILTLLYEHSPKLFIFAVALGALAGALYSFIIPFVLRGLNSRSEISDVPAAFLDKHQAEVFFGVCFCILVTKAWSVIAINNISKSAVGELRIDLSQKVNKMKVADIEVFGLSRLFNVITDDVNNLSAAAVAIPMLLVSMVTVVGMLGYLATLNLYVFLVVLSAILLGIVIFQVPVAMASGMYQRARSLRDVIQNGLRGLVMGSYELKLSPKKAEAYMSEELVRPQRESVKLEKLGDAVLHIAGTSSDLLSFFIIGIIVFIVPKYLNFPVSESYGVVMALLYIAGPVASILGMMQHLNVGLVALQRINQLKDFSEDSATQIQLKEKPLGPWSEYRVEAATYTYPSQSKDGNQTFSLSPISLSFHKSQINFIVGGNGSGKSTLSKLLSLHYVPTGGEIYFDNEKICPENIHQARLRISVIFSNYYLFERLYRELDREEELQVKKYLKLLDLEGKTDFIDGSFTTTKLSDGQRRRLALLVSLLDDKDIYIFDEWAADQDPEFKKIFYKDILQDMKQNGKLVIVITHDDRYFDCADRVIFMEDGRMIGDKAYLPKKQSLSNEECDELLLTPV